MDLGIGTDIEETRRFAKLESIKDHLFLNKIFTALELKYCYSKLDPKKHLAARFAGKEAVIKALNNVGITDVHVGDVEILNDDQGVPHAKISSYSGLLRIHISLSHTDDFALAFCIVMEDSSNEKD